MRLVLSEYPMVLGSLYACRVRISMGLTRAPVLFERALMERGWLMKVTRMACARRDRCTCFVVSPAARVTSSNVGCLQRMSG